MNGGDWRREGRMMEKLGYGFALVKFENTGGRRLFSDTQLRPHLGCRFSLKREKDHEALTQAKLL